MVYPTISNPHATTLTTVGGLDWNKIQQYFSGIDIGAIDITDKPSINTETRYKNNKFILFDSSGSNKLVFKTPALISTSVNVTFPSTLSNTQDNEITFNNIVQTINNKLIDSGSNSITNLRNNNLAIDAAIAWSKVSKVGSLLSDISNVDITGRVNNSSIRWDSTNNKWVMFVASTGLDVQLANLTDVILNTPATGQILQFNGTSWTNAESAATSSISKGPYTFSGNGSQKIFQIPHNVTGATPNIGIALATSDDAIGAYKTSVDSTYITITYQNPPPSGTNNLSYYWLASDPFGTATGGIDVTKIVKFNQANTYGLFDQVIPSGNFKLTNSGFKAGFDIGTLVSDITYTYPNSSQNLVGRTTTDTLLNKTLITPVISSLINVDTVTLPTGPTTIQGNDTVGEIFNKTINSQFNTISNIVDANISNSAAIAWNKVNKTGSVLQDLGNVVLSSVSSGQLLQFNGTNWVNTTISAVGETNTASNVGVGGFGLYKQKTGVNLEFKNINVASNKLSIVNDTVNNEVDLDVVPANILLNTLGGSATWSQVSKTGSLLSDFGGTLTGSQLPADIITTTKILDANVTLNKLATGSVDSNKIVDGSIVNVDVNAAAAIAWSKVSKTGAVLADIPNVVLTSPTSGQYLQFNGTNWINSTVSSVGEANTVSNVGVGGVGIYKQKTGVNLELRNINVASTKLSVALDAANNEVDLDVLPANLLLSTLGGTLGWSQLSKTGSVLSDIANVVLTSPTNTQVLTYNGTNWVNQNPASGGGGGGTGTSPVSNPKWGLISGGGVPSTGGTLGSAMMGNWKTVALTSGNVSQGVDADGTYISLNTTSTSQTNAEINSVSTSIFRGDLNFKMWLKIKIPNVANNRWFIGFTDAIALPQNTFNFLDSQIGFGMRYDTTTDSTLKVVNNNNTSSQTVTDTSITPANNTVYTINMAYNNASSNVTVTINGTTFTKTTNIPPATTSMGWLNRMQNSTGSVRNMLIYYLYCEQDK